MQNQPINGVKEGQSVSAVHAGRVTTQEALALFDALEPVEPDFMLGCWKGEGFLTGHPLDGLLEAYHWYGKRFESEEDVHPLVFSTRGGGLASVNPALLGPALRWSDHLALPRSAGMGRLFQAVLPLFTTTRSRARLRMTRYRGQFSATMVYDQLPINDVFRKIDADTVLGLMDRKGMQTPFFFILRRAPPGN